MSSKPARRLRIALITALWILVIGVLAAVLFSYLLPQDLTKTGRAYATLVELSFFGRVLTFHLGLVLAIAVIPALILRRRWLWITTALSAVALLAPTLLSLSPHDVPRPTGPRLRIMSMNLKYTRANAELFVDQIRKYNPEVFVMQDYTPYAESNLIRALGAEYSHRHLIPNTLQGLAIFSRLPFDGKAREVLSKTRRQMRAVVRFNGQAIAIYVEHPFSPRTRQRIINNRLATLDLVNEVSRETLPVIVAGDFNFTTETPNESALKSAGLIDTFEQAGHGRGSTWPVEPQWTQWLPGVRIDHIFISGQLTCTQFEVGEYDGSDHLPIVADVAVAPSR